MSSRRLVLLLIFLCLLLLASINLAVTLGPVEISGATTWRIAYSEALRLLGLDSPTGEWTPAQYNIIWRIRFPRVLLAALVGSALAVVGVTMQAMVRNPLADPYLLGVSSGASVGAVSVLAHGAFAFAGDHAMSLGAFLGAALASALVYQVARIHGHLSAARLILGGVAVGYFLSGLTSLMTLTADQRELARSALSWILGSVAGAQWSHLGLPFLAFALCALGLFSQSRALDALLLGDETASTLGVDAARIRRALFLITSFLTGIMVAVSGAIGFIGLMVPHATRMLVGSGHRRVLPVGALTGAIFLVWVDVIARTAFQPIEVPVGVITALLGGPFFVWLLCRHGRTPGMRS
ncbi:MAG: iron ABC transporter permease [Candidatus Accumulibacter sp.]|jgi:iron complex transport system permease protein|nr:iron ABC transporter permease [Accumulibacter sp.]